MACRRRSLPIELTSIRTYVSSLERCVYGASIDVLERLARVLVIEVSQLLKRPHQFSTSGQSAFQQFAALAA
jgi:hypothetical protein